MRKSLSYLDSLNVTFHKQSFSSMFTVHDSSTIWPDCGKKLMTIVQLNCHLAYEESRQNWQLDLQLLHPNRKKLLILKLPKNQNQNQFV